MNISGSNPSSVRSRTGRWLPGACFRLTQGISGTSGGRTRRGGLGESGSEAGPCAVLRVRTVPSRSACCHSAWWEVTRKLGGSQQARRRDQHQTSCDVRIPTVKTGRLSSRDDLKVDAAYGSTRWDALDPSASASDGCHPRLVPTRLHVATPVSHHS